MKFLSSSGLMGNGCVMTTSRLRKWWLTTVRGHSVERVVRQPDRYFLGKLHYTEKWVLRPPSESRSG